MSDSASVSTIDAEGSSTSKSKHSRGERKARKMLLKNNEKCIKNVSRVVFRQNDGSLYVIDNPEVYKPSKADTYIVFGEVAIANENPNQMDPAKAATQINTNIAAQKKVMPEELSEGEDDNTDIDESGLEILDIELVMTQANVSRRKAVLALRENNNDLVNTIMDLAH